MATQHELIVSQTVDFGQAVAISGNYAIVGARQPNPNSLTAPGEAHIFVKAGTAWSEQSELLPISPADTSDDFGTAVAIDGEYAIVGSPWHGPNHEGRAYIYHRQRTAWAQQSILAPGDPAEFGGFGSSVSISADFAIVGSESGAYVFQRTGSTWTQQVKLTGAFRRVSLSGQTAVVNGQESAIVFQRNGSTWQQQAVLTGSDALPSSFFGQSLSISGDHIIVGAIHAQKVGSDYLGAAYVFRRTGSAWTQEAKLEATSQLPPNQFATSVAISGDFAVVGDPSDDDAAPGAGAAYVFRRKGGGWPLVEKITASDAATFDWFGKAVAIDGDASSAQAIVGAAGKNAGVAYVLSNFPASFDVVIDPSKYAIYARILFGLTHGDGGVIWLPGTGPVPVDPEPFKTFSAMSPRKRDAMVGLAISELSNLVYDGASREEIRRAGLRLLKRSADQIHIPQETRGQR